MVKEKEEVEDEQEGFLYFSERTIVQPFFVHVKGNTERASERAQVCASASAMKWYLQSVARR